MSTAELLATNAMAVTEAGAITLATSTTASRHTLPDSWIGRWVTITAIDQDCSIVFGDSGVDVDHTETDGGTPPAISLSDTMGEMIPAGQSRDRLIPKQYKNKAGTLLKVTDFAIEAAGTGKINICLTGDEPAQ